MAAFCMVENSIFDNVSMTFSSLENTKGVNLTLKTLLTEMKEQSK